MVNRINIRHYLQSLLFLLSVNLFAQENIITAGFQYKPIFPSKFLNNGFEIAQNNVGFSIQSSYGFCAGMSIRRGITSLISFESGINYVKRKYQLSITDGSFKGESEFNIIGYEIPALGLVFIPITKNIFMDVGLGASIDMFPSSIVYSSDTYFRQLSSRKSWLLTGVLANVGYEFRTSNYGYFYLGASYHYPFNPIYNTNVNYEINNSNNSIESKLQGDYFTLDCRYFFHANVIKKKR